MELDAKTIFILVGLIYLITRSSIFAPIRTALAVSSKLLGLLLYCPACSGFWIGVVYALIYVQPWLGCVQLGLASMGLGAIASHLFHDVDAEFKGVVDVWQEGEDT